MGRSARTVISIAVSLVLGVVAAPAAWGADHPVEVQDNEFVPAEITITEGDSVTWTQTGSNPHSVTADDGSFDSHENCCPACMRQGDTYTQDFPEPGEYPYHCKVHGSPGGSGMSGVVIVEAAAQPSETPSETQSPTSTASATATPDDTGSPTPEGTVTTQATPSVEATGDAATPSDLAETGGGSGLSVVALLAALMLAATWIAGARRQTSG